jgi:hypothetical protein
MPALRSYVRVSEDRLLILLEKLQDKENLSLARAHAATSIATAAPSAIFQNTPFSDQDGKNIIQCSLLFVCVRDLVGQELPHFTSFLFAKSIHLLSTLRRFSLLL